MDKKKRAPQHIRMKSALNKAVRKLSSYDSLQTSTFLFGYVNGGGYVKAQQYPCHAAMNDFKNPLVVFSVYPRIRVVDPTVKVHLDGKVAWKTDQIEDRPYIHWLVSRTLSPWRSILPTKPVVAVVKGERINVWDEYHIYRHGFTFTNLNVPSNLLVNFCIATRSANEYADHIKLWWKLTQDGVHPSVAYWFALLFARNMDRYQFAHLSGHTPITAATMRLSAFERFCLGTPDKDSLLPNYAIHQGYSPCNAIWGEDKYGVDADSYAAYLPKMYPELWKDKVEEQRAFKRAVYNPWGQHMDMSKVKYDQILALAVCEQARLKLEFNADEFIKEVRQSEALCG